MITNLSKTVEKVVEELRETKRELQLSTITKCTSQSLKGKEKVGEVESYFEMHYLTEGEKVKVFVVSFEPNVVNWFR